jgi:FkbM family methyltransferase
LASSSGGIWVVISPKAFTGSTGLGIDVAMCAFALNNRPLMTRHLVKELRVFAAEPIVFFDVGARWGMNSEWAVFGDQMRVYCFEPDEEECKRLAALAPPHVTYLPIALSARSGKVTLFESALPASTSLYKTQMKYFGRLINRDNGIVVAEREIDVSSLDDVMTSQGIPHFDFIKLDVEGAELDVLKGASAILSSSKVLGVLSEIRLQEEINGSPPFSALDAFLRDRGFRLFDLEVHHQSRVALPYRQMHDYRKPSGERFFGNTIHGQVQDGDALYFRDLFPASGASPTTILKLCALFEIYSLNDCAAELVLANRERLLSLADPDRLLDLLAAGTSGSDLSYRDYMVSYFTDPSTVKDEPETLEESSNAAEEAPGPESADSGDADSSQASTKPDPH